MGMPYFKWFAADYEQLKAYGLTYEELGMVFAAVMEYLSDGSIMEVPDKLKWPFISMQYKVDSSQKEFDRICKERAVNGAKGGQAKARNQKNKQSSTKEPFTKAEFFHIAKALVKERNLHASKDNLDYLLDKLQRKNWTFGNISINTEEQLQEYVAAVYHPEEEDMGFSAARRRILHELLEQGADSIQQADILALNAAERYIPGKGYEMENGQFLDASQAASVLLKASGKHNL